MGTNITGIGNANAIGFKSRVTGGAYFPPELKDALVGVWSAYGKSNDSTDRNIIKNKIKDRGGDFVISNAAFKRNSGFGKYEVDFTSWIQTDGVIASSDKVQNSIIGRFLYFNTVNKKEDVPSFKVNITLGQQSKLQYNYIKEDGTTTYIVYSESGIYTIPASYFSKYTGGNAWFGFYQIEGTSIIEQIPSFEGAFVTDGIDDLITSTKTVQEMLGGSNEITVVSMIHQVKDTDNNVSFTNYIRGSANGYSRNIVNNYDKTGIYGYTSSDLMALSVVNNILGDKNDYTSNGDNRDSIINGNFSVQGYSYNDGNNTGDFSSVAWYWTIIANKVLTTDQINQVIAYFNLDRTLKSDIYCNIAKQGITNENHAEFGDKLIDFSGNGRDIQLNNIAWDGDSGIGKYNYPNWKATATIANTYSTIVNYPTVNGTYSINVNGVSELMQSIGLHLEIKYTTSTGIIYNDIKQDGVYSYILPDGATDLTLRFGGIPGIVNEPCNITITQIPSHAGALCLDGVNDFGQFVGDLELKDYTFIADRAYSRIAPSQVPFIASTQRNGQAPFLMEYLNEDTYVYPHSFGTTTKTINLNIQRQISYQSTYVYNGNSISKGISVDTGDGLTIGNSGSTGAQYSPLCLWSLMLFPYSMSEFLIERQLKKHKLGTLYPDMVEFRPVITINGESGDISYANDKWENINIGDYINIGEIVHILLYRKDIEEISNVKVNGAKFQSIDFDSIYNHWNINIELTSKSPQKIDITIDEYIRFEDIVQPYPVLLRFNDENGNEVSWGGKFRVGSTITRIGSIADPESNLLNGLYSISGLSLNGKAVTSSTSIVEKQMVFKTTATWLLDNSKPKCILSPSRLRIPNSSYKLLGYIPDISGHGNHGKINNSAYAGMSGVNGYPVVFGANKTWANESNGYVTSITNNTIHITNVLNAGLALLYSYVKYNGNLQNIKEIPPFKIEIKGLEGRSKFIYKYLATSDATKETNLYLGNGTHELPKSFLPTEALISNAVVGFSISPIEEGVTNFLSDITIKVLPEYEGAYCLDGVDDFVTIPTTVGGKQVLMKVNWDSPNASILYDQRGYNNEFAIYNGTNDSDGNPVPAYQGRNNGQTYIDGILNSNIKASELRAITHNITITNELSSGANKTYPIIGSSKSNAYFVNMALYDFMLFDEISTDDKIKELNEYIGLSGNIFEFNPPTFTIDLPMAIKNIKVYQGGNEISPGYLYPNKDTEFEVYVSLNDGKYAVDTITVDDVEITKDRVVGEYNIFKFTLNGSSEQKITIHSYEYIMYEDIIQPYPSFVKLENLDRTHTYTWGDKLRIGDTIRYNSSKNLLEGAYTLRGQLECNGVYVFDNNQQIVVTKEMVFAWSHSPVWTIGNSAPKCVFSPSKLRIPNSSYKYLGYIPDISGNGNHGVFNNFAFSKMSGADGYPFNFRTITVLVKKVSFTDDTLVINRTSTSDQTWVLNLGKQSESFDLYVNWEDDSTRLLVWAKNGIIVSQYTLNKEWNSIPVVTDDYDYIYLSYINPSTLGKTTIKQKAKYEGSICFDGVDDYITIPTLSEGGKQVLMKVNWQKQDTMLYNQNPGQDNFAIFTNDYNNNNLVVAYASRNNGNTYIDGVVNNNILATQLKGITHNIVATNNNIDATITPIIGSNKNHDNFFAQMALYDFMLFDEISTDEEIKELNNIVGIEGDYVQKPSYYWDAYGKSNLDVDKGYIKDQVSLQLNNDTTNNNSLENFNFGYEGMSGYNGYPVIFGANKTWKNKAPEGPNSYICTINANKYNITQILLSNAWTYSYIKENGELTKYNKDVESFKIKVTGLKSEIPLRYSYLSSTDATVTSNITIKSDGTYELPKSFANDGSLIDNYGWIGFSFTRISVDIPEIITDVNITIEILPEYKNGLVYDGVDDYSENASIPLLSDYTYIFKRTLLNKKYNSASIFKGSNQQSGGGAFICDYNSVEPDLLTQGYSFGAGLYVDSLNADSIVYGTRGSVNGTKITAGNNTDTEGLTVGKWRAYKEMVFYKLFLYPRTVNMLSINMVKNMMEEDGIIDLTSKLFTDKYTGDFYEMDFNNDFLIGN